MPKSCTVSLSTLTVLSCIETRKHAHNKTLTQGCVDPIPCDCRRPDHSPTESWKSPIPGLKPTKKTIQLERVQLKLTLLGADSSFHLAAGSPPPSKSSKVPKFQVQFLTPKRREIEDARSSLFLNQVQTFFSRRVNITPSTCWTGHSHSSKVFLLKEINAAPCCLPARRTNGDSASLPPFILWLPVAFYPVCVCLCV